jgi:hypothetical protein
MIIGIGDLSIEVLGFERHRGSILCLLSVSTPFTSKLMLLNKGKFESSSLVDLRKALGEFNFRKENGAEIYENGAITQGGFIVFFKPVVPLRDNAKLKSGELQLPERMKTELYRLIIEARLHILTALIKASVLPGSTGRIGKELLDKLDIGVWSDLKPLLYAFVSDSKYVYGPVNITFIPYTFKAEVEIKKIRFYTVKAIPRPFYYDGYIIIGLGKRDIYVVDGGERTLVYHVTPSFTYVHEQYRGTVFPPALVTTGYFNERKWSMLHAKLGNVLLVPESADLSTAEKLAQLPEKFGKVEVLRGEVFRHDGRVYVKSDDGDVVLYHPYRGTLVVRAGTYRVERIEYVAQNVLFEKWRDRVGGVLAELAETNEEAGALLEELRSLRVESLSEFIGKLSGVIGEDLRLLTRTPRPTREDIETWIKATE